MQVGTNSRTSQWNGSIPPLSPFPNDRWSRLIKSAQLALLGYLRGFGPFTHEYLVIPNTKDPGLAADFAKVGKGIPTRWLLPDVLASTRFARCDEGYWQTIMFGGVAENSYILKMNLRFMIWSAVVDQETCSHSAVESASQVHWHW